MVNTVWPVGIVGPTTEWAWGWVPASCHDAGGLNVLVVMRPCCGENSHEQGGSHLQFQCPAVACFEEPAFSKSLCQNVREVRGAFVILTIG